MGVLFGVDGDVRKQKQIKTSLLQLSRDCNNGAVLQGDYWHFFLLKEHGIFSSIFALLLQ